MSQLQFQDVQESLTDPMDYSPDQEEELRTPDWTSLSAGFAAELSARMGGPAQARSVWDELFDSTRRLRIMNTAAALNQFGLWGSVTWIGFLRVNTRRRLFRVNLVDTEADNQHGWELAITTGPEIWLLIAEVCPNIFANRSRFNHPEARWSLLEKGSGIVMHLLGLRPPSERFTTVHFDAGGGRFFNRQHLSDYWRSNGPTQQQVTAALLRQPAGEFLRNTIESGKSQGP